MSRQQRLAFAAIAAVIAVIAIVVLSGGGEEEEAATTAAPVATATPSAPAPADTPQAAEPAETPRPTRTPEDKGPVLEAGSDTVVKVTEGETVRFSVKSDRSDHVHVHGYDFMKDVKAGGSVDFAFKATITGIFEIELEDSGVAVGQLKVEP